MTPVMVLSDGYLGNGSSPWRLHDPDLLPEIHIPAADQTHIKEGKFMPYLRDDKLSRPWAKPGKKGFEHRIGGLSKENETGKVVNGYYPYLIKLRNPGPLGLRLVDPTARRARSEVIGSACNSFKE